MTEEETMDAGALREALEASGATPFRYQPDGMPCWCISADEPHVGWIHAPACDRMLRETMSAILAARLHAAAAREPVAPAEAPTSEPPGLRAKVVAAAVEWVTAHDALALGNPTGPPDSELLERYSEACNDLLAVVSQNRAALAQPPAPVSVEAAWRDTFIEAWYDLLGQVDDAVVRGGWTADEVGTEEVFDRHRERIEAAIRGTTAGTPLDVELLVKALAAVDERIAVEFPEEATEMRSDEAALGRRSYAEAVAVEYAVALRGQPSETPAAGDGETGV